MRKSSEKGSRASLKKLASVVPSEIRKENIIVTNEPEIDDTEDEEEQPIPALTSSSGGSGDNMDSPLQVDSETGKTVDTTEAAMTKIQGSAHEGTGTSISSQIQNIIARELSTPMKKGKIDLQSVPLKEYLEQTVIPIVHQGLLALARERPSSPIEYLAAYFLKHKQKYQSDQQTLYGLDQDTKSTDTTAPGNAPQTTTSTNENAQQGANEAASVQT